MSFEVVKQLQDYVVKHDHRGLAPVGSSYYYQQMHFAAIAAELDEKDIKSPIVISSLIESLRFNLQNHEVGEDEFFQALAYLIDNHRRMSFVKKAAGANK